MGIFSSLFANEAPPANRLQEAIGKLEKYYAITGGDNSVDVDLGLLNSGLLGAITSALGLGSDSSENTSTDELTPSQRRALAAYLFGNSEGAYCMKDLRESILVPEKGISEESLKKVVVTHFESSVKPGGPTNAPNEADEDKSVSDALGGTVTGVTAGSSAPAPPPPTGEIPPVVGINADANATPSRSGKNSTLSAMEVKHRGLTFGNRHTGAASVFMNGIPTHEMSLCSPHISLTFISDVPGFIEGFDKMSLVSFAGAGDEDPGLFNFINKLSGGPGQSVDDTMASAYPSSMVSSDPTDMAVGGVGTAGPASVEKEISSAGMELFTSPQSLINIAGNFGGGRYLNPTVPFMSLESLTVDVVGLGDDIFANKTATLQILVHDRSRLVDIAPIIAADAFGATHIIIEYGWSHPHATGATVGNVYADFLNSLKTRHAFNIVSSGIDMLDDGQVRVNLRLASRGVTEMVQMPAGSGLTVMPLSLFKPLLTRLSEKLGQLKGNEAVSQAEAGSSKSKVLTQIHREITANLRAGTSPGAVIPIAQYYELLDAIAGKKGEGGKLSYDLTSLKTVFDKVSTAIKQGTTDENVATLRAERDAKIAHCFSNKDKFESSGKWPNPFAPDLIEITDYGTATTDATVTKLRTTLGQLFLTCVGHSLQATRKFDEVQLIFYPFNDHAAACAGYESIAQFRISEAEIKAALGETDTGSMSLKSFMQVIIKEIVQKPANPNYGLSSEYEKLASADEGSKSVYASSLERKLADIYAHVDQSGQGRMNKFVIPDINIFVECLPMMAPSSETSASSVVKALDAIGLGGELDSGNSFKPKLDTNILRIHVFDAKDGIPFHARLLNAIASGGKVATTTKVTAGVTAPVTAENGAVDDVNGGLASKWEKIQESLGIVKSEGEDFDAFFSDVDVTKIKNLIKSSTPSITFGTQYSNIKSITLRSTTSSDVDNVLFLNAIDNNAKEGTSDQGTPPFQDIFVIPTRGSIECAGFPLLEYGQKFYIDMGTGTTADNFYYITGIRHSLRAGEFTTSADLTFAGNAEVRSLRQSLEAFSKKK
tara:strand:- start:3635 stop:6799 length:3165 start_codon:yes stop_codon:yes gene_type:complete